jgi:pilus assembly protein Flp/PilA
MNFKNIIADFIKDEEGLTMVEYAIAGALVAAGAATAFQQLGGAVTTEIGELKGWVETAPADSGGGSGGV